jgi:hypothetical protein
MVAQKSYEKILDLEASSPHPNMGSLEEIMAHIRTCVLSLDVILTKSDTMSSLEQVQLHMQLARLLLKFTSDYEILDEHLLKAVSSRYMHLYGMLLIQLCT